MLDAKRADIARRRASASRLSAPFATRLSNRGERELAQIRQPVLDLELPRDRAVDRSPVVAQQTGDLFADRHQRLLSLGE